MKQKYQQLLKDFEHNLVIGEYGVKTFEHKVINLSVCFATIEWLSLEEKKDFQILLYLSIQ
jgi:hypothetical protein